MAIQYYMEYKESKKILEEGFDAYYKIKNSKRPKFFRAASVQEKVKEKTEARYKELRGINRKERTIKAEFSEDRIVITTGDQIREYQYQEIESMYETDTTLVLVAGKNRKKDAFIPLKKGSLKGKNLSELKKYLLEKCPKVTGIITSI